MKIDSSTTQLGAPLVKDTRNHSASKTSQASNDKVQLSALSAQFSVSGDDQSFDAARVLEIKQAIAEGRFTINAGAIAERLIDSAKELVNSQRQA